MEKIRREHIKLYAKEFKLKKRSDAVWCDKDGMFYYMYIHELGLNNSPHIDIKVMAKPMWLDDIYWTIERAFAYGSSKPKGAHADYDRSVRGLVRSEQTISAADYSDGETSRMVRTAFELFAQIPEISEEDFLESVQNGEYENPVGIIITAIRYRDYTTVTRE